MDSREIREALRAQVPVHQSVGHGSYIVLADIPQPRRGLFHAFLRGSDAPLVNGVGPCAWPVDWQKWLDEDDWWKVWRRQQMIQDCAIGIADMGNAPV